MSQPQARPTPVPAAARPDRTVLPEHNLDVLRAVAVLAVVAEHALGMFAWRHTGWEEIAWRVAHFGLGRLGVLLFFVHTALVLMSSLERLDRGEADRGRWAAAFYLRRAFRIYPLAIFAIAVTIALGLPPHILPPIEGNHYVAPSRGAIVANVLLVTNLVGAPNILGVLWSLPLEVQMYVLLPACYLVARRRPAAMAALVAGAVALGLMVHLVPFRGAWRLDVLVFAPCFMAGILAYHLARRVSPRFPGWAWPIALAGVIATFGLTRQASEHPERGWVACLLLGTLIPLFRDLAPSVLARAAHAIAKYSYGVYLWHIGALWIGFGWGAPLPLALRIAISTVTLVLLSVASYHGIEKPMIDVGARVGDLVVGRRRGRAVAVVA